MKRLPGSLFLVAAGAAAVLLLAVELVLRASGYNSPHWYRPDPQLGWVLRANASGWYSSEGRSFVRINSAGQRDREHTVDKPEGVYRIAVLGDAYSEAMQVALEESYWAQLPERLQSCGFVPGKRIEVLNFGVRDYGTAQAYLVLERTALRYRPDLVVLQFSHGNDLRDNSYALDGRRHRPYFSLDAGGALRLDDSFASEKSYLGRASFRGEAVRALADHSRVLQLASRAGVVARRARVELMSAHARSAASKAAVEVGALAAPRDPVWVDAWQVTETLIAKIGESATRHGARVAVVPVPFAMEVHPDRARRESLQAELGVADLGYPGRRVAAFARQIGMQGVLLAPEMKALAAATGSHLYGFENMRLGFGHWNALGHRAAADIIARALCANPVW